MEPRSPMESLSAATLSPPTAAARSPQLPAQTSPGHTQWSAGTHRALRSRQRFAGALGHALPSSPSLPSTDATPKRDWHPANRIPSASTMPDGESRGSAEPVDDQLGSSMMASILESFAGASLAAREDSPALDGCSTVDLACWLAEGYGALANLLISTLFDAACALRPHVQYWKWALDNPQWFQPFLPRDKVTKSVAARLRCLRHVEHVLFAAVGGLHLRLEQDLSPAFLRLLDTDPGSEEADAAAQGLLSVLTLMGQSIGVLGGSHLVTLPRLPAGSCFVLRQCSYPTGLHVSGVSVGEEAWKAGLRDEMVIVEVSDTAVGSGARADDAMRRLSGPVDIKIQSALLSAVMRKAAMAADDVHLPADSALLPEAFFDSTRASPPEAAGLAEVLLDHLDSVANFPAELASALAAVQRPGHLRRQWAPYSVCAMSLFVFLFYTLRRQHSLHALLPSLSTVWEWLRGSTRLAGAMKRVGRSTGDAFFAAAKAHVVLPLRSIVDEFVSPTDLERDLLAVDESRAVLSSMLGDFLNAIQSDPVAIEKAANDPLHPECWRPVMNIYDEQVKRPVWSMMTGEVARALLLQLHRTKLVIDQQVIQTDRLLIATQFTMNCIAVVPAILMFYGVVKGVKTVLRWLAGPAVGLWPVAYTLHPQSGELTPRSSCTAALRELDRQLTTELLEVDAAPFERMVSRTGGLDDALCYRHGKMLAHVHRIEAAASELGMKDEEQEALAGDLLVLKDTSASLELRLRTVQRIRRFYPQLGVAGS
eukprot:TRINITY_DN19114_c0_g1_i1.p1 TRINITY_DN19114_c0_g1~~TRINITY_DN19114_c0_g1_i1.p1  ORF type:complete len:765 (+),score=231.25 TRINITY_DN19114_c0_g1_i1:84-2378(+)